VDFVLSRANSVIHHEEEVDAQVDSLLATTLLKAAEDVKLENEEIANTLNSVIGDAIIKAATGVQGEKNLRQALIEMFKETTKATTETTTMEKLEEMLVERMAQAFQTVELLHRYFKQTPYLDSERDMELRSRVLEAYSQAKYMHERLDGGVRTPAVGLEETLSVKNTLGTSNNNDVDY